MSKGHTTRENQDAPSWVFENIAELSKHARAVHTIQLGFLIYCAFTILTTPDRKIILDEQAHLPIINLDVPFSGFVLAAPVVALFIFVDFQIHLQVLKATISRARTGYAPIARGRLYPWFGNFADEPEPGLLGLIQRILATISLWLLMPAVLIMLTVFTFKKHNAGLNAFEWAMSCLGSCLALWLWHRYNTMPGKPSLRTGLKLEALINGLIQNWTKVLFGLILGVTHLILLVMVSDENRIKSGWFSVDLSNQVLIKEQKEGSSGYRADLKYVRLDGANLHNSTLTKADLEGAELQRALMQQASLDGANLYAARLNGATLSAANLQEAHLVNADLTDANLNCANLTNADFQGARLTKTALVGANLTGARNLSITQLTEAASLFKAVLDKEVYDRLCATRPDLLREPVSEVDVLRSFPPNAIRTELVKFNQVPQDPPAESTEEISKQYVLLLSRSGSESFLVWEQVTHTRERRDTPGYGSVTKEYLRRVEISKPFLISCYQNASVASVCK